jgi:ATP-dependent DNA helicase RecG
VVFPKIDPGSEKSGAALLGEGSELQARLRDIPSGVVHGRLAPAERNAVMGAFISGELRLLLATTVIEVGVDVPQASIMVIESAERFGLAQLHQLRGRVGRGEADSHCLALHGPLGEQATARLSYFAASRDGFALAEADLEIRGPGDVMGTRQSGLPDVRWSRLLSRPRWIEEARRDAAEILERSGEKEESKLLQEALRRVESRRRALAGG